MTLKTRLTELLNIDNPILLAPMDQVADARLSAAVSAAGGLGILGGGYGHREWLTRELGLLANSGQRFGVGFITWSLHKQPELLDLALEYHPAAVMLSFGDPGRLIQKIRDARSLAICQVQTVAMARDAITAGADLLVAQGTEAGGHGGSRGLFTLLPEIVDIEGGRTPVIAAGGIADGRGVAAALMLGACGVLMGTRFYASEEAATPASAKARICRASGDDTVRSIVFDISRRNVWPAPFTGRCLRNSQTQRWLGREVELLQNAHEAERYASARAAGDFDVAAVIAGEAAGLVRDVLPAGAIVARLVAETTSALQQRW